ncbi:MAG: formylglycine-generating enzyme family protein, partial [Proteobacteria bacterium]|nr:formylglycine-generating enzyme family protein [Pseudomonadota bacterium]
MKTLTSILYGLILCVLFILAIKMNTPDVPEGMTLIPAGGGIDAFYMDAYEVTNTQYRKFMDANPQWQKDKALTSIVGEGYLSGWNGNMYPREKANHPVVNVGWFAAKAYAEWVGKELPTEAQWERAARGSLEDKKYPWGDAKPRKRANYNRYTRSTNFRNPPTKQVGSYAPNKYGLYDMAGNVEEWCLDRLDAD